MTIKEIIAGNTTLFALLKDVQEKEARSGKKYLTLTLYDRSGEIKANLWNTEKNTFDIQTGTVVHVNIDASPYNGSISYTVKHIRVINESDNIDMTDFVAISPIPPETLYNDCCLEINNIIDDEIAMLVRAIYNDYKDKILKQSAAKLVHHNIIGGLLWHVHRMLEVAKSACSVYGNINRNLVIAGIMLHDIGKIKELETDVFGTSTYTNAGMLFGHTFMGAELVRDYGINLGITPAKIDALTHIILSHHGKQEWGAVVVPATTEAYLVHSIDLLDSHIYIYEKTTESLEPNTYSERQFGLAGGVVFRF